MEDDCVHNTLMNRTIEGSRRWAKAQNISEEERASKYPSLEEVMPEVYKELDAIQNSLEEHYRDMQDIEFTIQDGKLWMLQCRLSSLSKRLRSYLVLQGLTK